MKADGFDDSIIGTVERCGQTEAVILYDKDKVISRALRVLLVSHRHRLMF